MSRATKRKHVLLEVFQDDFSLPTENQQIVRLLRSKGNNLHEAEFTDGNTFLVSMPTKFRKNMWVKRGDYVLIEPIKEGDKVKAEIVRILTSEHIKCFKNANTWPEHFTKDDDRPTTNQDSDIFVNTNRPMHIGEESTSESSEASDDDCDEK